MHPAEDVITIPIYLGASGSQGLSIHDSSVSDSIDLLKKQRNMGCVLLCSIDITMESVLFEEREILLPGPLTQVYLVKVQNSFLFSENIT